MVTGNAAEQSIRVLIAFFAALVGFGLKNLLDKPIPGGGWLAFLVAVALFLRFMTGAANHLWREHLKCGVSAAAKRLYVLDLAFLTVFGIYAVFICYAGTASRFLVLAVLLLATAIAWEGVDKLLHHGLRKKEASEEERRIYTAAMRRWGFWLKMNVLHLIAFVLVWLAIESPRWGVGPLTIRGWTPSVTLGWGFLVIVSVGILLWDFVNQVDAISDA